MKIKYYRSQLPLDKKDKGYNRYMAAEKIRIKWGNNPSTIGLVPLLGGLDHITISPNVVTYFDIGINNKYHDLVVNPKKSTARVRKHKKNH